MKRLPIVSTTLSAFCTVVMVESTDVLLFSLAYFFAVLFFYTSRTLAKEEDMKP